MELWAAVRQVAPISKRPSTNEVYSLQEKSNVDIQRLVSAFDRLAKAEWRKQPLLGIKNSEMRTLLCIKNLEREGNTAITVSEISHRMFVTSPTVTQTVNSLEKNGYIERKKDPHDKRVVDISLTGKGEEILGKVTDYLHALFSGLVDRLGEEQCETLLMLLDQVSEYLDEVHVEIK